MNLMQYTRLVIRESRGSRRRLVFFVACLAVGVAAIVAVAGLSTSMDKTIRAEARRLLAADVAVSGRRPVPEELAGVLEQATLSTPGTITQSFVREVVTVVAAPPPDGGRGASRLAELKIVDGLFPFYGELTLDPMGTLAEHLAADTVVVAPELLAQLELTIGDELLVGGEAYRIVASVLDEPDQLNFSLAMGPRVFLSPEGLDRAKLLGKGSRVRHEVLLKLPGGATADDAEAVQQLIKDELPDAEYFRVSTYVDAQPSLRAGIRRISQFLGLVGLLSLLIGGVGVAQTVRAWIAERFDAIAVMRCLGLRPREAVTLYAGQTLLLGLAGSLVGAAIGIALQATLPGLIAPELVPAEFNQPWQPLAILQGIAMGVGVTLVFSLPPLLTVRRVPPARVFRSDSEPLRSSWVLQTTAGLILLVGVWIAATLQGGSAGIGAVFAGGLIVVVMLLTLGAVGLSFFTGRLPRHRGRLWLRHGLARLARPGAATVSSIVALGLGVMIVLAMHLVERHLTGELAADLPDDAPSSFLVDIQPDQWDDVRGILQEHDAASIKVVPLVMTRIRAIDGTTVEDIVATRRARAADDPRGREERSNRWALTREQRLTYYDTLPDGNEIVEGTLWSDPAVDEISVEADFARNLGVSLGSTITVDIQGVVLDLRVTSLRTVDWRTFGVNFFLVVEPGVLESAPQMRIATAQLPPGDEQEVQDRLAAAYPNITLIHIRGVLDKLVAMLDRLAVAVQLLGGFTVAAGIIILAGAISASAVQRGKEVALLKTLGMTRREVSAVFAVEYALVGLAAAVIGGLAGSVLAWAVLTHVMEITWEHRPVAYAGTVVLTIALVVVAGLMASTRALASRPIEVLRTQ